MRRPTSANTNVRVHQAASGHGRNPQHSAYSWLVVAAIACLPLQQALTLPEPLPIRLPTDIFVLMALAAYVLRGRDPARPGLPTEAVVVLLLMTIVVLSAVSALASGDFGSTAFRQQFLSPEFDVLWYSVRALLILAVWFVCRRIPTAPLASAFVACTWIMTVGVVVQQSFMSAGLTGILESLGYNTTTSGVLLNGATTAAARSGTFPNGQELGFLAGAMVIVMLKYGRYLAAAAAAYCLLYSLSTTGYVGLAIALLVSVLASRGGRARVVGLVAAGAGTIAVASSSYLRSLLDFQLAKVGLAESSIPGASQSLEIRSVKTELAFQIAAVYPVFGAGASQFGNHVAQYSGAYLVPPRTLVTVENVYGQLAAEHGFAALFVFVLFQIVLMRLLLRHGGPYDLALAVFVGIAVVTQSLWTQSAIWMLLGYLGAVIFERGRIPMAHGRTRA